MRVCAENGCPQLTEKTRCLEHTQAREKRRGTRQKRGYGVAHERLRKRWAPKVAAGTVNCWRCEERLNPLEPWDLGHLDDRGGYGGPEHVGCNRATSGR